MALQITKTTEYGVETNYHNIGNLFYDKIENKLKISVASYLNEETRNNNSLPLERKTYDVEIPEELLPLVYDKLKELEDFEASIDV